VGGFCISPSCSWRGRIGFATMLATPTAAALSSRSVASLRSIVEPGWLAFPRARPTLSPDPGVRGGEDSAMLDDAAEKLRPCSKENSAGSDAGTVVLEPGRGSWLICCGLDEIGSSTLARRCSESKILIDPERSDRDRVPLLRPLKLLERRRSALAAFLGDRGAPYPDKRLELVPEKSSKGSPIDRSNCGSSSRCRAGVCRSVFSWPSSLGRVGVGWDPGEYPSCHDRGDNGRGPTSSDERRSLVADCCCCDSAG
jgi:hypothetical protein